MELFGRIRNLFRKPAARPGGTRASYDSAATTRYVDWAAAQDIGPNEALSGELSTIRARARHERRNNGVAKGLGRKYANVAVGRAGPRLKVVSTDRAWSRLVESAYRAWASRCGYRFGESWGELLHLGVREFFPCGEFLMVPRIAHKATTPVKLRFLMIRPDRLTDPDGISAPEGIERDEDGVPARYWIMKRDADNASTTYSWLRDFLPVPADRIIHCFVQEDPIQMRGEPWLATAINVFRKIRRLDDSTLSAMEIATKFAAFLSAQFPELGDNFEALLPSVMDLEDGTLTTLPPGYEPKQVKPEHPGHNVHEFRRDQYAAAGAGSCMPVNAVTGDSSKHNFASARFDGNFMVTDAEFVRGVVESRACDKAFLMWLEEAIAVGQVPTPRAPYYTQYLWPTNDAHTDPTKKQNADRSAAEIGRKTVGDLVIEDGRDDDDHRDRLLEEVEWYRGHGLQHPLDAAAPAGTGKEAADEDGKDGDDEKDDAEK